jgi:hypothetical protein
VDDGAVVKIALDRAWTVHLALHEDVDPADARRCTLARYLDRKLETGQTDPEELTCAGLAFLSRPPSDAS